MKFIHFIAIAVMVVAILASPLKGETWVVLAKPGMEVIGTFELEKGGVLNIDVDTRQQCLKLIEVPSAPPIDLVNVMTIATSQETIEGKSIDAVTVSISKAKIEVGFTKQKYIYDFQKRIFELKQAVAIEK